MAAAPQRGPRGRKPRESFARMRTRLVLCIERPQRGQARLLESVAYLRVATNP